jgi:tRNA(Arg) A34 adenosine deaminase TadA
MCFSAILWARIPVLVFSASCLDASQDGVGFLDKEMHSELMKDYRDRKIHVFQALCPNALDAFVMWKEGDYSRY